MPILVALTVHAAPAEESERATATAAAAAQNEPSIYDGIWKHTRLYENTDNSAIQSLTLSGRFQLDFARLDADEGDHDEWNIRRLRLGAKVTLFRNFTVHGEVDLNPQEADPLYVRITDFYMEWSRNDDFRATIGKQGAPFTMDGSTSSKELLTLDRSNFANNFWFPQEYLPGMSVSGELDPWVYHAGIYSSGSANREFGNFDGSVSTLLVMGYDFAKRLGVKEALVAANFVHQWPDVDNTFTRSLEDVLSLNFKLDAGSWGLRTDLAVAEGYLGQSDLFGAMAIPYYNVTDALQVVGRYTFLESDGANGVRLATYESRLVSGRGDEYNEIYFGANYYFYGHKLKLQTGLQFADMEDRAGDGGAYSGLSWTSGLRVSW